MSLPCSELIGGLGPLPPGPGRRSPFLVALAQALWYISDGRPYEELMASSGLGFRFAACADAPLAHWGEPLADLQLEVLGRATGLRMQYVELADTRLVDEDPREAWQLISEPVHSALEERRPVLARGGWQGADQARWGVITGWAPDGLPAGHVYRPDTRGGPIQPMCRPPWQLIALGSEVARPQAGRLAREVLAAGVQTLGQDAEVTRVGQAWTTGPAALQLWAARVDENDGDAGEHERLILDYRARRRHAGTYLGQTAGLQLGQVRAARDVGRQIAALGEELESCEAGPALAAALRATATRERELATALDGLLRAAEQPSAR